jgi:hypothetical protein
VFDHPVGNAGEHEMPTSKAHGPDETRGRGSKELPGVATGVDAKHWAANDGFCAIHGSAIKSLELQAAETRESLPDDTLNGRRSSCPDR